MYLLGAFVALIIGVMATEYPIFGITLLLIVIAGAIWFYFDDLEFPEIVRKAALDKISLVIAPTGQSDLWPAASRYISRSRAFENGVFVAYANSCGENNGISFIGESKIINPKGLDVISAKNEEELIIGDIDLNLINSVREKLPYLDDSREIKNS